MKLLQEKRLGGLPGKQGHIEFAVFYNGHIAWDKAMHTHRILMQGTHWVCILCLSVVQGLLRACCKRALPLRMATEFIIRCNTCHVVVTDKKRRAASSGSWKHFTIKGGDADTCVCDSREYRAWNCGERSFSLSVLLWIERIGETLEMSSTKCLWYLFYN